MEDELTLDEAVLHVQMFRTVNEYVVAAVSPVTVHVGVAKLGTPLHVLVEAEPPEGVCCTYHDANEQPVAEQAAPAVHDTIKDVATSLGIGEAVTPVGVEATASRNHVFSYRSYLKMGKRQQVRTKKVRKKKYIHTYHESKQED